MLIIIFCLLTFVLVCIGCHSYPIFLVFCYIAACSVGHADIFVDMNVDPVVLLNLLHMACCFFLTSDMLMQCLTRRCEFLFNKKAPI